MRLLLTISLCLALQLAQAEEVRMLVQRSPLAGSQYTHSPLCGARFVSATGCR